MKINKSIFACKSVNKAGAFFLMLLITTLASFGEQDKQSDKLDSVLKRMEKSSGNFKSFEANILTKKYTAVIEAFDPPESGRFFFKRAADGSALIRWEIINPTNKFITVRSDEVVIYKPMIKYAERIKLGEKKDKAEYLALGIGQSPADLQKTFNITYQGSETLNGAACSILELRPKDLKTAAVFSSITLWIKDATGISTQMKLEEPFEDYLLVNFSNEQLNNAISDSKFEQKLPKDVEILQVK
jgi:outer membrane lipoprotein-sorting protein